MMLLSWLQNVHAARARNTGAEVGTWPDRMQAAWQMFRAEVPQDSPALQVADFGCGQQELRHLLPQGWSYAPYDYRSRSADTRICDFSQSVPDCQHDVIFMLGVLEYLPNPARLLRQALTEARWTVFSCVCGWAPLRSFREGWNCRLSWSEVEEIISQTGAKVRAYRDWGKGGGLWVCEKGGAAA